MENLKFIDKAKVIDINNLPKINGKHESITGLTCIEVKIVDFKEDYIIYQATFCEDKSLYMLDDFYIDCCHWLYAVKRFETQ